MSGAYYNEINPHAAERLRLLIKEGLIADGEVDTRSIELVEPADVRHFTQCHFFAGIGGWSIGLRLGGWRDYSPIWTGSCPCQPFSVASVAPETAAKGQADPRHLLPKFASLATECGVARVVGEQVASAIKWGWLDEAATAFEDHNYAFAAAVMPALAVGARHERKRIYWVADAGGKGRPGHQPFRCFPLTETAALSLYGDPLIGAGRALAGDYSDLLPCDGLSVALERLATHDYGNAIVPQQAALFIKAITP